MIVSDWSKASLTILDASNGTLLKIIDVKGKAPHGLTVDGNGNIYMCSRKTREICVWSNDFSESRTLLVQSDIQEYPITILYNRPTDALFVGYESNISIDKFQISVAANK